MIRCRGFDAVDTDRADLARGDGSVQQVVPDQSVFLISVSMTTGGSLRSELLEIFVWTSLPSYNTTRYSVRFWGSMEPWRSRISSRTTHSVAFSLK